MPDPTVITDDEITRAIADRARLWDSERAVTIAATLLPTVRALLDRPRPGYTYRARVHRWVDADTVELNIDLGLRQWTHEEPIRLLGVNAPDRNPAKAAATRWVRDLMPTHTDLIVRTHLDADDKYGRLLGDLYLGSTYVNQAIIDAGHGQPYTGGARPSDY